MAIWDSWRRKEPVKQQADPVIPEHPEARVEDKGSWFDRLRSGLKKTRQSWGAQISGLLGRNKIDAALFEALEERLIQADLGWPLTEKLIAHLQQVAKKEKLVTADELENVLKQYLLSLWSSFNPPSILAENQQVLSKPQVILVVGVNGVGKTTTIGKLAGKWIGEGKTVLLAAGDTFRAAAIEQLKIWGDRVGAPVVAQQLGSDSAAVVFDAFQSAQARDVDIVLADTAGRLHNKSHLMQELEKIKRVLSRLDPSAPHEVWLVLDASVGQNALQQVEVFHQALKLTGLIITKLDGTAKAGVLFQLIDTWSLPVHFIGVGEQLADLQPFDPRQFVEALFSG